VKNYETLMYEIEENIRRQKDILCSLRCRINVKIAILLKFIYRLYEITIKIPITFFSKLKTSLGAGSSCL
jgi:hypothetical protein